MGNINIPFFHFTDDGYMMHPAMPEKQKIPFPDQLQWNGGTGFGLVPGFSRQGHVDLIEHETGQPRTIKGLRSCAAESVCPAQNPTGSQEQLFNFFPPELREFTVFVRVGGYDVAALIAGNKQKKAEKDTACLAQ